jgi:hypothetical protein
MCTASRKKLSFANISLLPWPHAKRLGSFGQVVGGVMLGALLARRYAFARVAPLVIGMSVLRRLQASSSCAVIATTSYARSKGSNSSFKADGFAAA